MQEFLQYVIPLLIDYPEEMVLTRHEGNKRTTFLLKLRQSDVGKIIGKHGLTIIAIRNLLAASLARIDSERDRKAALADLFKALGGGWEIRSGQPFVPDSVRTEMQERTDWGNYLSTPATVTVEGVTSNP